MGCLMPEFLQCSTSEEQREEIASDVERKWEFNHCLGAIDGKHIVMQASARYGLMFFNYKKKTSSNGGM